MRRLSNNLLFTLLFTPFAAPVCFAEGWQGEGEAGYLKASGNTDSENIDLGLSFLRESEKWRNQLGFSAYKSTNDGVDSADSYEAGYTVKRFLSERSNLFVSLSYLDDEFDGFTEQSSIAAGYGYKLFDRETFAWETGIGVGYRDTEAIVDPVDNGSAIDAAGLNVSGATFVFRSELMSKLTDNTRFDWEFKSEIGADNSFYQNDAALQVDMNAHFALKLQIVVRHNTDPAPSVEKTDTISTVSLVYKFGAE